jgi:hypothetical protein
MSGSFRINFLEPKFVYHYEDDYSKIFKDEEQSNDFFDGREKLSKKIFLTLLPELDVFLGETITSKIRLEPIDLLVTNIGSNIVNSGEEMVSFSPGVVSINLNKENGRGGFNFVTLNIASKPSLEDSKFLIDNLRKFNYSLYLENERKIDESIRNDELVVFKKLISTNRYSNKFSLAISLPQEIRIDNEPEFKERIKKFTDGIFPKLEKAFEDEEMQRLFFDNDGYKRLISYKEKFKADGEEGDLQYFNVYGPSLDDYGMRFRDDIGLVNVSVLFLFDGEIAHPNYSFTKWFRRVCWGEDVWKRELEDLFRKVEDSSNDEEQKHAISELVKIVGDQALLNVGGREAIEFLLKHARSSDYGEKSIRTKVISEIRYTRIPEFKKLFFEIIKERKLNNVMNIIAQGLAEYADDESASVLIELLQDPNLGEDDRRSVKYGLKQMDVYLKNVEQQGLKEKIANFIKD